MTADPSSDLQSNVSFILTVLVAVGIYFLFFWDSNKPKKEEEKETERTRSALEATGTTISPASKAAAVAKASPDDEKFILLLGVDDGLFKSCFGDDDQWLPCRIMCLAEDSSASQVCSILDDEPGLQSVVIQEDVEHPHWNLIKKYYLDTGGFVVYFGIYGEFAAPATLSRELGLDWKFSAYTKHDYVVTDVGQSILGTAITRQQYSKANLLCVPEQDRLMMPEILSVDQLLEQDGMTPEDEDYEEELQDRRANYDVYRRSLEAQCPLALHTNDKSGGKFAYLGFVNGEGDIPALVRALLTGEKTKQKSSSDKEKSTG